MSMDFDQQKGPMAGAVLFGRPVAGLSVSMYRYEVDRLCGSGKFGSVYLAKRHPLESYLGPEPLYAARHDKVVAIKFVPLHQNQWFLSLVKREVTILNKLTHPHIIEMTDHLEVPWFVGKATTNRVMPALGIVMDRATQTLHTYLVKSRGLQEDAARWFFQQLILAVDHCHKRGIGQRDIKPSNILIFPDYGSRNLTIKLTDFGYAKQVDESSAKTRAGTIEYMAPEIPSTGYGLRYSAQRADVWSCGMVLLQMMFPREFDARLPSEAHRSIWEAWAQANIREYELHVEQGLDPAGLCSSDCIRLLVAMLEVDPAHRATIDDVMRHPWFTKQLPEGALELNERAIRLQAPFDEAQLQAWLHHVIYKYSRQ